MFDLLFYNVNSYIINVNINLEFLMHLYKKIVYYLLQACDYCIKSLESAEGMCKRLLQNDAATLPYPDCCPSRFIQPVTCPNCEV